MPGKWPHDSVAIMTSQEILAFITGIGIVPIVRVASAESAIQAVEAIYQGGVRAAEITMTVPGAIRALEKVADRLGDKMMLGAGDGHGDLGGAHPALVNRFHGLDGAFRAGHANDGDDADSGNEREDLLGRHDCYAIMQPLAWHTRDR